MSEEKDLRSVEELSSCEEVLPLSDGVFGSVGEGEGASVSGMEEKVCG